MARHIYGITDSGQEVEVTNVDIAYLKEHNINTIVSYKDELKNPCLRCGENERPNGFMPLCVSCFKKTSGFNKPNRLIKSNHK